METGGLTSKSNDTVQARRYSGTFGQPSGHGSVLEASVRRDGRLVLTVTTEQGTWTAELSNEQRKDLAAWVLQYEPVLWEDMHQITTNAPSGARQEARDATHR